MPSRARIIIVVARQLTFYYVHLSLPLQAIQLAYRHGLRRRPQDCHHAASAARSRRAKRPPTRRGMSDLTILLLLLSLTPRQTETQRALLRALRPQARLLALQGRGDVLHPVHGEVHGRLEHRQQAVRRQAAELERVALSAALRNSAEVIVGLGVFRSG